jgi:hypothetical protein
MTHGHKIVIKYKQSKDTHDLYVNATDADLGRILHAFDQSVDVDSYTVFTTVTVPTLAIIGKTTELYTAPSSLKKLR